MVNHTTAKFNGHKAFWQWIFHGFSLPRDLTRTHDQRVMWLY